MKSFSIGIRPLAGACLLAAMTLSGAAQAQDLTPLTVVVPNPSALNIFPLHVADAEGYFAEEGLDVTVEVVNGSASVLQTLVAGQAQIGQPGPGPLLAARERGEDIVILYNYWPKSVFGLVVKEGSEVASPSDLKGKTIGVGTADGAEVGFTRAILSKAGLEEGRDYEFLTVGDGGTAVAAFMSDEIDAYAAAVADAAIIEARGIPLTEITPDEFLAYFGNGWAATRSYIDANPDVIEGFGRAMVKGTRFGLDPANTEAVLAHAAAANPQEGEDARLAAAMLETMRDRVTPIDSGNGFGYQPPEHWKLWQDAQVETQALSAPLPDLSAAYTNDFVERWNAQ
ncbi:ABC transporter substrate-binding protein [Aureimonas altamirensis]|uniref:ABC transporter substrate-binding protein n=1 Tax=Aureimonas altamirensis TaxID=370622 RepID=UPI002036A293|nr:ABC transporter substrate-binding protein [Aureimonas altamirensis]MCM2503189.1 ABC transporter substrate-binding protein [Aureimonas altamirensis]